MIGYAHLLSIYLLPPFFLPSSFLFFLGKGEVSRVENSPSCITNKKKKEKERKKRLEFSGIYIIRIASAFFFLRYLTYPPLGL